MNPKQAVSKVQRSSVIQWFGNTLVSRLNDKSQDVIIVVMQRLHVDDLVGALLEQGGWHHLDLPAIADTFSRNHGGATAGEGIKNEAASTRAVSDRHPPQAPPA
jgi:hypothetical protein